MIEEKLIVGKLLVQGEAFDMLDLYPQTHAKLPWLLREHAFEFLVIVNGVAQGIIVSRNSFAIIPALLPESKLVEFVVENEKEEQLTDTKIAERINYVDA